MNITFLPGNLGAAARNAAIKFGVLVDGTMLECEVSERALREHCGAKSGLRADLMDAFETERDQIQAIARFKITDGEVAPCCITVVDFEKERTNPIHGSRLDMESVSSRSSYPIPKER